MDMNDDMLWVTIYMGSVTDWPDDIYTAMDMGLNMHESGELIDVLFPRGIVESFYKDVAQYDPDMDFDTWYNEEYTAEETDGLYEYAVGKGFTPEPPKPEKYEVEFTSTYTVYAFTEDAAVTIAREQHSGQDDSYIYVDGKMYS